MARFSALPSLLFLPPSLACCKQPHSAVQPLLLFPKPISPSVESSLLPSPAPADTWATSPQDPGAGSSPQPHPAPGSSRVLLHAPAQITALNLLLRLLSNGIPGGEIEMQESPGFYLFLFFPPLDRPRPPLQSPRTARPGPHLNPSLSDRKPLPQQAQSWFLCGPIKP